MKVTVILILIGARGTIFRGFVKGLEKSAIGGLAETIQATLLVSVRIPRDTPNTERYPEYLKRLAVTLTLVKDDQLTLLCKSLLEIIIMIIIIGSPNPGQKTRLNNNQQKKKKRTCKIVDFVVSADPWIKLKELEKKDKYLDLVRELKKLEHAGDNYTNCYWCVWNSN